MGTLVFFREQWWGPRAESFRDQILKGEETYRRGKNQLDKMPKETRGVWVRTWGTLM